MLAPVIAWFAMDEDGEGKSGSGYRIRISGAKVSFSASLGFPYAKYTYYVYVARLDCSGCVQYLVEMVFTCPLRVACYEGRRRVTGKRVVTSLYLLRLCLHRARLCLDFSDRGYHSEEFVCC
jgi:hypothetical protein